MCVPCCCSSSEKKNTFSSFIKARFTKTAFPPVWHESTDWPTRCPDLEPVWHHWDEAEHGLQARDQSSTSHDAVCCRKEENHRSFCKSWNLKSRLKPSLWFKHESMRSRCHVLCTRCELKWTSRASRDRNSLPHKETQDVYHFPMNSNLPYPLL